MNYPFIRYLFFPFLVFVIWILLFEVKNGLLSEYQVALRPIFVKAEALASGGYNHRYK